MDEEDRSESHDGGDPACWLRRVCPACGQLAGEDPPTLCPACGTALPDD